MGQFRCRACGLNYTSSNHLGGCPQCMGLGLASKECTCVCFCSLSGIRINSIHTPNPNCPVHGSKETSEKK